MGTILAILSIVLSVILFPIGVVFTMIKNLYKKRWKYAFKNLDNQMLAIATSIDASGNVVCLDLFNFVLIKKNGYKFGKRKETISSVLGKNQRDATLTKLGCLFVELLDKIEKDHCLINIDNNV